jgi:hypothetical protein
MATSHRAMAAFGVVGMAAGLVALIAGEAWLGVWMVAAGASMLILVTLAVATVWPYRFAARRVEGTEARLTVDKAGLEVRNALGSARLAWSDVDRVTRGRSTIVLTRRGRTTGWVPTAAVGAVADVDDFVAELSGWIADAHEQRDGSGSDGHG